MSNFITILHGTEVASSNQGVALTDQFENINGQKLLAKLREVREGNKDGAHWLRTTLNIDNNGRCMKRCNDNATSSARLLIIDCDKRINSYGEVEEGAPDPWQVCHVLKNNNIGYVLYGTYSHYTGKKGNRYRILLSTETEYKREQLAPTAEAIVSLINIGLAKLEIELLDYAKENSTWAQPWYFSRKPKACQLDLLHFEYLEGFPIPVHKPHELPLSTSYPSYKIKQIRQDQLPIQIFNEQNQLNDLLIQYGYKRTLVTSEYEKWLSPESSSGIAGTTVKGNKFFSHHNDQFNDGYWHDAFDLMKGREGLSSKDAIIKISPKIVRSRENSGATEYLVKQHITPKPLPEARPAVMPFQAEMLPEAIRDYVYDVADRQQSLPDFVAVAAIVGLSGLLGRKALIYPKQLDDWSVTPNQWGAIIGRPSAMKSPSMKEALKPLRQFDIKAAEQFEEDKQNYEEEYQLHELEIATAKGKAKKALKADNRQVAREALRIMDCAAPPIRQRLVVNDTTVEKLGELLNENPNGLILVRDELSGWLAKINKEDHQSDRAFYLECFDGNGHYTYDRIGRGTIEIQSCTLLIIGGIQPSKIATLVRDAIKGTADDGLIQRFQLAIWPDDIGRWEWIDRAPNSQAKEKYYAAFERLYTLNFNTNNEEPHCFRFTDEAQQLFVIWMKEIQDTARNPDTHPTLESHMLKMPQTIAGLALLFEIIDGGDKAVGIASTARALEWADYLLSHAKRLYSLAINHSLDGAKLILKRKSQLSNPLTAREIGRKGWSGLDNIEAVKDALNWLIDYGHMQAAALSTADTNGRPKIVYQWVDSNPLEGN